MAAAEDGPSVGPGLGSTSPAVSDQRGVCIPSPIGGGPVAKPFFADSRRVGSPDDARGAFEGVGGAGGVRVPIGNKIDTPLCPFPRPPAGPSLPSHWRASLVGAGRAA